MRKLWRAHRGFILFFSVLLVVGLIITPKFGLSVDEPIQRQHRLVNLNYVAQKLGLADRLPVEIQTQMDMRIYPHKYYGIAAQSPLLALEFFFHPNSRTYWVLSHYYTHAIFLISVVALYGALIKIQVPQTSALLTTLLYVLSPRIYAHSFYNIKDLLFLSLFMLALAALLYYLESKSWKTLLLGIVVTALSINSRMMGIILIPYLALAVIIVQHQSYKRMIRTVVLSVSALGVLLAAMWPAIWRNPIRGLSEAFATFSDYSTWDGTIIFQGSIISGNHVPWSYVPQWILITVPIATLVLWLTSLILAPVVFRHFHKHTSIRYLLTISLLTIVGSLSAIIIFSSTLYGDWRHLYYLHVPFTLLSGATLYWLSIVSRIIYRMIVGLIIASSLLTITWMVREMPHFYVYFNPLAGTNWDERWDRDIWRLSTIQMLESLLENSDAPQITILRSHPVQINSWLLDTKDRKRLQLVDVSDDADYIVADYRNVIGDYSPDAFSGFTYHSSVNVQGLPIMSTFVKTNSADTNSEQSPLE